MHDDIQVFSAVVEQASFAGAAKTLGLTRSAVCRRIDRFEKRLGVRLLDRTTRRVDLTDAGGVLYERSLRILGEIADAEIAVSQYGGEPQGVLRITTPIMIGLHKVIPLLPEFSARHPQIKCQLNLSDDAIDPALTEHDVALRWGAPSPSSIIITRVGGSRMLICAAPSYLERFGTPQTPDDLLKHNCLMMTRVGLTHNEWTFRRPDGGTHALRVTGNFVVNGGHGNYQAMMAGLGIARVADFRARPDIETGRLVEVLKEYVSIETTPIFAAYKGARLVPPKVRAFVTFMQQNLQNV